MHTLQPLASISQNAEQASAPEPKPRVSQVSAAGGTPSHTSVTMTSGQNPSPDRTRQVSTIPFPHSDIGHCGVVTTRHVSGGLTLVPPRPPGPVPPAPPRPCATMPPAPAPPLAPPRPCTTVPPEPAPPPPPVAPSPVGSPVVPPAEPVVPPIPVPSVLRLPEQPSTRHAHTTTANAIRWTPGNAIPARAIVAQIRCNRRSLCNPGENKACLSKGGRDRDISVRGPSS